MRGVHSYSGRRWGEKSLLEWTNIPTFLDMYPSGKTIHIIRDPRDVVASYKNMTYETKDKYLDSIFNCLDSMKHAINYLSILPKSSYYLVKFEDLVNNRMIEIEKICKFLQIEFNEADYSKENIKEGAGAGLRAPGGGCGCRAREDCRVGGTDGAGGGAGGVAARRGGAGGGDVEASSADRPSLPWWVGV